VKESPRLLIFGKSGFLGTYLSQHYQNEQNVYTCSRTAGDNLIVYNQDRAFEELKWDPNNLRKLIHQLQPKVVINAIALTNANLCEKNPQLAKQANSEVPDILSASASQIGARVVQISTDAVFGQPGGFFSEEDEPIPKSVYGLTKLLGEEAVRKNNPNHLIIRTNFYGYHKNRPTLFNYFYENFKMNNAAIGFGDVYFNPVYIRDLVLGIDILAKSEVIGTIHFVGDEILSKYDFGVKIAKLLPPLHNYEVSCQLIAEMDTEPHRKLDLTLSAENRKRIYQCDYNVNSGILESIQRAEVSANEL
jgi:dTDP-4-dehydrorhamnose reductase